MSPAQFAFFPVKAVIEYPKQKQTADALGEVGGEDGHHYYVKTDTNARPTRASEWLSTHLAEAVGIAAPTPSLIQLSSGKIVFGSRKVCGTSDEVITGQYLLSRSEDNTNAPVIGISAIVSTIYAFDMFMFNDDRHFGNYLSYDDNGVRRLHAFDFSRCLFWAWPWDGYPPLGCNTRTCGGILRSLHGFDTAAAIGTVTRLGALSPLTLQGFINRMPPEWLPEPPRSEFVAWWSGPAREQRARRLIEGLNDGVLL